MQRRSEFLKRPDLTLEVSVEGTGHVLIILPSYGRRGGDAFGHFARKTRAAGFRSWVPSLHGIAGEELRRELGVRMTTEIVLDGAHALFPDQPEVVAQVDVRCCQRLSSRAAHA